MTHCQLYKPSIVDSVRREFLSVCSLFCFFFPLFGGDMVLIFAFIMASSVNYFLSMVVHSIVL